VQLPAAHVLRSAKGRYPLPEAGGRSDGGDAPDTVPRDPRGDTGTSPCGDLGRVGRAPPERQARSAIVHERRGTRFVALDSAGGVVRAQRCLDRVRVKHGTDRVLDAHAGLVLTQSNKGSRANTV